MVVNIISLGIFLFYSREINKIMYNKKRAFIQEISKYRNDLNATLSLMVNVHSLKGLMGRVQEYENCLR